MLLLKNRTYLHPYPPSYIHLQVVTEMTPEDVDCHERYAPVQPTFVGLQVRWKYAVLSTPTRTGVAAQKQAVLMRVGKRTPEIQKLSFHRFRHHCCCQNVKRIGLNGLLPDEDVTSFAAFLRWLENTHYSGPRKKQLIQIRMQLSDNPTHEELVKFAALKCFIKPEGYGCYKPPRGIMSRTDWAKVWVGPSIKCCEKIIYALPEFIKHIKCNERARYIRDRMVRIGCIYAETDYSSFEGAMRDKIMCVCEFSCLKYLCRNCPRAYARVCMFQKMCVGVNTMRYTDITARIKARRMSGEMTTSFGNGWTNLMLATFVLKDVAPDAPLLVEGDDGIVTLPPYVRKHFTKEAFASLGFVIKIDWHDDITETGFCGVVCDPAENAIITNPIEAIASFGWCSGAALRASNDSLDGLLRAKALSLAYQYPGCPILTALARLGVRISHGHKIDAVENPFFDGWHKDILVEAEKFVTTELLAREPGPATRSMMSRKYGISAQEQIYTERYLDSIQSDGVLEMPWLLPHCHKDMIDSARYFVREYRSGTPWAMIARALN